MRHVDAAGSGSCVQLEGRILGEIDPDAAGAGFDVPVPGGPSLERDASAAGARAQRAPGAPDVNPAGTGAHGDVSLPRLRQVDTTAARTAHEAAADGLSLDPT